MFSTLELVILLLAAAVAVVGVFRFFNLPPVLAYLLVGASIGPHAINLVPDSEGARYLAEFGVVFLMFSIGLEFSLPRLYSMKRIVFGLGLAQVLATIAVAVVLALALDLSWRVGFALGGTLAMSSTAILSKLLTDRMQLDTPHGREIMGVLLFQDIAVVPLLILIPSLSQPAGELAGTMALALAKATVVLVVVLFLGQRLMGAWFYVVARRRSAELFMLNILLITLGLAYLTELAGLSLALGAFLAGMLISETEYRYQVEEDIKPFRDVLLGLFFVTVGAFLDVGAILQNLPAVLGLLALLMIGKLAAIAGLSRAFGANPGTALRTGLWLCAGGEFGFVLVAQMEHTDPFSSQDAASDRGGPGAVDAAGAAHRAVRRRAGAALRQVGMAAAVHGTDTRRRPGHGDGKTRHHLRLRAHRTIPVAAAGAGGRILRRPGPRSGARARGRGRRRHGRVWRLVAARDTDRRRHHARQRGGGFIRRRRCRDSGAASDFPVASRPAGGGARHGRAPDRTAGSGRRRGSRAGDVRGQHDDGLARAGAAGGAGESRGQAHPLSAK